MLRADSFQPPLASRRARLAWGLLSAAFCCQGALGQQLWMPRPSGEVASRDGPAGLLGPTDHLATLPRPGAVAEEASAIEELTDPWRSAAPSLMTRGVGLRQVWHWIERGIREESDRREAIELAPLRLPGRPLSANYVVADSPCKDPVFWRVQGQLLTCEDAPPQRPSIWSLMQVGDQAADWSSVLPLPPTVQAQRLDGAPARVREGSASSLSLANPPARNADAQIPTWSPSLHVGITRLYDNDGSSGGVGALDRLFPLSQISSAYGDFGGREPVYNISVGTSVRPTRSFSLSATVHWLRSEAELRSEEGSVSSMMRLPDLSAWPDIGAELDISLHCRIGRRTGLLFGYGRFFASDSIDEDGPLRDVEFVYASVQFRF